MMMSELLQIRRAVPWSCNTNHQIMYEKPGMGNRMAEEERKDFLANDRNRLLARIEFINEKDEPNIIPTGYYFDGQPSANTNATHL
ncbi:MAG TPA: hypothetical protein VE971_05765 [Candidatus Eisenbacteria bacterium]|nr:hypothetical protein [Candidatus Eisenbacteria bacterium]